jgi:Nif-specific regulatory protein
MRSNSCYKDIIGGSKAMRRMFDLLEKVIDTPTTILLQGETGTGKELIAKVIHYNGPLKDKPFVAENCGALPANLLESELFGHVKGAFTGAITNKKGLFEIADGGTIFLDEVGEMSLHMQVKLLRVLQEGQFRPVGGNQTRQVDVRIISSTNRDLASEVKNGNFREDLYYRINVFKVTPPPLRERKEDILSLANHFLKKYAGKIDRPVPRITPYALDLLMRFDWPGNVRELENEMERALAMAGRKTILSEEFLSGKIRRLGDDVDRDALNKSSGRLKDVVQRVECRLVKEALKAAAGNRSRAAKALGLSRQGLLNKIKAYHIRL